MRCRIVRASSGINLYSRGVADMAVNISIDPGRNTGICVWQNGKPLDERIKTLRADGESEQELLASLQRQVDEFLCQYAEDGIDIVAIEKFPVFHSRDKHQAHSQKVAMMMCAQYKGVLFAVANCYAKDVITVSKGRIQKSETKQLADAYGLKGSKDALDAFQIGICAGFDKRG